MKQTAKICLGNGLIVVIVTFIGSGFNYFFPDALLDNFTFIIAVICAVILANKFTFYIKNKKP